MSADTEKAYAALQDDMAVLQKTKRHVTFMRDWVGRRIKEDRNAGIGCDALESLHYMLDDRAGSLGATIDEIQDEMNAFPSEHEEHRRDYYSNLGVGRTAA